MLSHTCKTAIKAVIYLGSIHNSGLKAGMKEIAREINASEHTVGKILQSLVKEDVIRSVKGPNGGFYITSRQLKLPINTIIHAIDGKQVFEQCGLGLSKCSGLHPCPLHNEFKVVRDLFKKVCTEKRITDLYEPVCDGNAFLFG